VHCRSLWRFGDASRHEPGLTLRIQSHGFGYPFAAPALESSLLSESCGSECGFYTAWRFGDASRPEPGLALRIQSQSFGYPFAAPALGCCIIERLLIQSVHFISLSALGMPLALSLD